MTFLSHSGGRRTAPGPNRRQRGQALKDATAVLTFVLAVGFAAAFVFGFLGH
jgi:hypothetical protein